MSVAIGVAVVGAAGYAGFVAFAVSGRGVGAGMMMLGAVTGFAAFFSPCSFPLLVTFLSKRSDESRSAAMMSAIRIGVGAAVLLAAVGVVVALSGAGAAQVVAFDEPSGRVFRLLIGSGLVLFGLRQARWLGVRMRWLDRVAAVAGGVLDPSGATTPGRRDLVYGFGYLLAGFG